MDIKQLIDDAYNKQEPEEARAYIGASGIGQGCDAALAFSLRGFPNDPVPARTKRMFELGHILEKVILSDMAIAGMPVDSADESGRQHGGSMLNGHVKGHADGIVTIDGERIVFEAKSMNKTKFNSFVKHGVKQSHSHYYSQVQMLMGLMDMNKALLVGYCKDNSDYHGEFLTRDLFDFEFQTIRISQVMFGESYKCAKDQSDYRCKMCFKTQVCWHEASVEETCNTCTNGSPVMDADKNDRWECRLGIPFIKGCASWKRYRPENRK